MERHNLFKRYPGLHKIRLNLIFIMLFLFTTGLEASAHKVNVFAYAEGNMVFTESYFNDGRRCVNSKIEVFDFNGNKLLEGNTDKAGEFSFKVPEKIDLRLVLTASMGHRAEYTVRASELQDVVEKKTENLKNPPAQQEIPAAVMKKQRAMIIADASKADLEQIKSAIEDALEKKLRPIIKLIAKSQEHRVSFTEVIGGIGYIFGIMGIIMYFRSRKR